MKELPTSKSNELWEDYIKRVQKSLCPGNERIEGKEQLRLSYCLNIGDWVRNSNVPNSYQNYGGDVEVILMVSPSYIPHTYKLDDTAPLVIPTWKFRREPIMCPDNVLNTVIWRRIE